MALLKERETAERLNQSVQTLRNHRSRGIGVPYVKLGKSVRYCAEDVERFIREHRIETAPAAEAVR
jgi:hypothetical protein